MRGTQLAKRKLVPIGGPGEFANGVGLRHLVSNASNKAEPIDLQSEFERLADFLSEQPLNVRDLFRNALVLAMIDDEKARISGSRVEGDREFVTVRTIAGDVFEMVRPEISEEVEAELMAQVRAIIAEEGHHGT